MCACVCACVRVSLGGGVVELVLPGAAEAGCDAAVLPEPLHHAGQLGRHEALLRRAGQDEELPRIVLRGRGGEGGGGGEGRRGARRRGGGWSGNGGGGEREETGRRRQGGGDREEETGRVDREETGDREEERMDGRGEERIKKSGWRMEGDRKEEETGSKETGRGLWSAQGIISNQTLLLRRLESNT